jgi:hypothetical protein
MCNEQTEERLLSQLKVEGKKVRVNSVGKQRSLRQPPLTCSLTTRDHQDKHILPVFPANLPLSSVPRPWKTRALSVDHDESSKFSPTEQFVMDYAPWTAPSGRVDVANAANPSWQKEKQYTMFLWNNMQNPTVLLPPPVPDSLAPVYCCHANISRAKCRVPVFSSKISYLLASSHVTGLYQNSNNHSRNVAKYLADVRGWLV